MRVINQPVETARHWYLVEADGGAACIKNRAGDDLYVASGPQRILPGVALTLCPRIAILLGGLRDSYCAGPDALGAKQGAPMLVGGARRTVRELQELPCIPLHRPSASTLVIAGSGDNDPYLRAGPGAVKSYVDAAIE